jgi:hypothetical protein
VGARPRDGEELVVATEHAVDAPGVRAVRARGAEFRTLLRRARAYVVAPRREDFGIAQLEALADGCRLVTTAPPGRTSPATSRARSTPGSSAMTWRPRSAPPSTTPRRGTPSGRASCWRRTRRRRSTPPSRTSCCPACCPP